MPGNSTAFVDESTSRGYLVAAAALPVEELGVARKTMRGLVLPGQRRLHFQAERERCRMLILDAVLALDPEVTLCDGSAHPRRGRRAACLRQLVADAAAKGTRTLVLETDESLQEADRRVLYRMVREHGCPELAYRHLPGHAEPLLALPDAVAWCWQRGSHWRARVRHVVGEPRPV